jgi:hypothetical protein
MAGAEDFVDAAYDRAQELFSMIVNPWDPRTDAGLREMFREDPEAWYVDQREVAEEALELIRDAKLASVDYGIRGLVFFPDLLGRYLREERTRLSSEDWTAMLERCLEAPEARWARPSFSLLLAAYLERPQICGEGRKWPRVLYRERVDEEMLRELRAAGLMDPYLDDPRRPYSPSVAWEALEGEDEYRTAYHFLLHGKVLFWQMAPHLADRERVELIAAARDFTQMPDAPIGEVIARLDVIASGT